MSNGVEVRRQIRAGDWGSAEGRPQSQTAKRGTSGMTTRRVNSDEIEVASYNKILPGETDSCANGQERDKEENGNQGGSRADGGSLL